MIIVKEFNDGVIGQLVDGKYVFMRNKVVSKSFDSIKELNDAWKNNNIWSEDGKKN